MNPQPRSFEELNNIWQYTTMQPSMNHTSNMSMPDAVREKLLKQDVSDLDKMEKSVAFEEKHFSKLSGKINEIRGFEILAGLQRLYIPDHITLFRAVRFPTPKRICDLVSSEGFSISNYEQERLDLLYSDMEYKQKREDILRDPRFPYVFQERIVDGIPAFLLANDAIQIHRAYRTDVDKIVLIALFIPDNLLNSREIRVYSNLAIDSDLNNTDTDRRIDIFRRNKNGRIIPDYKSLNKRIIDIYESYLQGLPTGIESCSAKHISQKYFLMDIYRFRNFNINTDEILSDISVLMKNASFLHGFMGTNSFFERSKSEYLPFTCYELKKK